MFTPEKNIFSILGQTFPIYGKSVKYLAVITLMAFVPAFAFIQFIPPAYAEAFNSFVDALLLYSYDYGHIPGILDALPTSTINNAVSFFMIIFGIELAFSSISVAAATYLVFKHLKGEKPSFSGMFTAALPILPKMIVTSVIAFAIIYLLLSFTMGVFGGFLMILTIYISVGMVFYQHIVADVGRWGFNAISLSRFIIRGRWFKVFFGFIVITICYSVLYSVMYSLWSVLGIEYLTLPHLPFYLLQNFVLSYFAITFALWYFDIKRFHSLNFQQIEKEIMDKMRQHIDRFGKDKEKDRDNKEENEDDNSKF